MVKEKIFTKSFVESLKENIDKLGIKDSIQVEVLKTLSDEVTNFIRDIYFAKDPQSIPVFPDRLGIDYFVSAVDWLKSDDVMNWSSHKLKTMREVITNGMIYPEYIAYNCPELLLTGKKLVREILCQFHHLFFSPGKEENLVKLLCLGCKFYALKKDFVWTGTSYLMGHADIRVTNKKKTGAENKQKAEDEFMRLFNEEFYPDWEAGEYDGRKNYLEVIGEIREDYRGWQDSQGHILGEKRAKKLYSMASDKRKRKKCV